MHDEKQTKSLQFINTIDKELLNNILLLNQKLRGMQAEIASKIDAIAFDNSADAAERNVNLHILKDEISKAIVNIKAIVELISSEEEMEPGFMEKNQESIETLREIFKNNLEHIEKIKGEF